MAARARIHNPTNKERWRLRLLRAVQAFAALPPVFYVLSWMWPLAGIVMVSIPVYVFLNQGDKLGVGLMALPALGAIYELVHLPMTKNLPLLSKFFWSVCLGIPVLGLLFFWITYQRAEPHSAQTAPPPSRHHY